MFVNCVSCVFFWGNDLKNDYISGTVHNIHQFNPSCPQDINDFLDEIDRGTPHGFQRTIVDVSENGRLIMKEKVDAVYEIVHTFTLDEDIYFERFGETISKGCKAIIERKAVPDDLPKGVDLDDDCVYLETVYHGSTTVKDGG